METKLVCNLATGEVQTVFLDAQELEELVARRENAQNTVLPPAPTKEQLLAQLQALQAQINALA